MLLTQLQLLMGGGGWNPYGAARWLTQQQLSDSNNCPCAIPMESKLERAPQFVVKHIDHSKTALAEDRGRSLQQIGDHHRPGCALF